MGNQLKAAFFLCIISLVLLHNVLPHHHSQFASVIVSDYHDNDHQHKHSHSDHNEQEETKSDFLFSFILDHAHSLHDNAFILVTNKNGKRLLEEIPLPVNLLVKELVQHTPLKEQNLYRHSLFKERIYSKVNLLSYSLRGPPHLG